MASAALRTVSHQWTSCRNNRIINLVKCLSVTKHLRCLQGHVSLPLSTCNQQTTFHSDRCQHSLYVNSRHFNLTFKRGKPSNLQYLVASKISSSSEPEAHLEDKNTGRTRTKRLVQFDGDDWLSAKQWREMKTTWQDEKLQYRRFHIPQTPFEFEELAMETVAVQKLDVTGKSLLEHIRSGDISIEYPLISKCLFMCVSLQNVEGILWCTDWLEKNASIMDKGTIANVITGLCMTEKWRECEKFITKARKTDSLTPRVLEPFLEAACKHGDKMLARSLLEEHYDRDLMPSEASCLSVVATFHCSTEDVAVVRESEGVITDLLEYMRKKRFYPSQGLGEQLATWFSSKRGEKWRVSHTRITPEGICESCQKPLESLELSEPEFSNLREEIFRKVIRGKDIFKKSTPQELEAFMDFVDSGPTYDVVLDGLNLANLKKRRLASTQLREFVEYLAVKRGMRCLVLGRQHMLKQQAQYHSRDMAAIQDLADCFFTHNISEDDPFMLYATMHSGAKTRYVTRDMLRDHKALLSPEAHLAFVKWQRTQQLIPIDFNRGKAVFQTNLAYDTVIQSTENSWHIPYDDGQPRFSYQVPLSWLCAVKE